MASINVASLVRTATKPVVKVGNVAGQKAAVGARMIEVNYRPKEGGWQAPVLRDYGMLKLRPQIAGLHYGLQVFDHCVVTRDASNGKPRIFFVDCFLRRLAASRDYLHFAKYDDKDLYALLQEYIKADEDSIPTGPGQSMLVRTCIIGDNSSLSAGPADSFKLFMFGALVDANAPEFARPLKLKADPTVRRTWLGGTGSVSVGGNYANQIYHEQQARTSGGFDKLLWLVDNEAIATAGDANFFALFKTATGAELVTPALGELSMAGSTRDTIIDIVKAEHGNVKETTLTCPEFVAAVKSGTALEAFATSSAQITRPIGSVFYNGETYTLPEATTGVVAARMKSKILSIFDGTTPSPLSKFVF